MPPEKVPAPAFLPILPLLLAVAEAKGRGWADVMMPTMDNDTGTLRGTPMKDRLQEPPSGGVARPGHPRDDACLRPG